MDTREKLIDLIYEALYSHSWDFGDNPNGEAMADILIANGVTVQEWIPVTERLPEYGQPVLVCDVREDYVGMAVLQPAKHFVFSKSKDYWDWDRMECQIDEFTHWMPLPAVPKGE